MMPTSDGFGVAPRKTLCTSDSMSSCSASVNFRPPAANTLTPLSENLLCDAVIITPGTFSSCAISATAGVGKTPSCSTRTPTEAAPAENAASRMGPDTRGSRAITKRGEPRTVPTARPRASAYSGVISLMATPRTPSVPNDGTIDMYDWGELLAPDIEVAISASCTVRPYGPCADRTSCFPYDVSRGSTSRPS